MKALFDIRLPVLTREFIENEVLPQRSEVGKLRQSEERKDFYLKSYPAMLAVAKNTALSEDVLIHALAAMTYGWMPTIPKNLVVFSVADIKAVSSNAGAQDFIASLDGPLINNSWVGTSKMLHFINPEYFPIWDSRIARNLTKQGARPINANNKRAYRDYSALMHEWSDANPTYAAPLIEAIQKRYGYRPTRLRCIELVLFSMSWQASGR